jgi:hypothetical protein
MSYCFAAFLVIALLTVAAFAKYSPTYKGPAWQSKSAAEKMSIIWNNISAQPSPHDWYGPIPMAELLVEDLGKSFTETEDDMPTIDIPFDVSERKKLIHTVGAIAQGIWVAANGTQYTGIFGSGCKNVVLRFSAAAKPDVSGPTFVPGISVKCFRDGRHSGNVMALYSLTGQKSYNPFKHDLTNHVGGFDTNSGQVPLPIRLMAKKFKDVSFYANFLGLSDLASIDESGTNASTPTFPFRLIFHPTTALHTMFPDDPQEDYNFYLSYLETVPQGKLFDIYVQDSPSNDTVTGPIGSLYSTGPFAASYYGDRDLFFQHTFFDSDLMYRPDWTDAAKAILNQQATLPTPFVFPDLPFN